jgi:hypothetical protein
MNAYDAAIAQLAIDWPTDKYPAMNNLGRMLIEDLRSKGKDIDDNARDILSPTGAQGRRFRGDFTDLFAPSEAATAPAEKPADGPSPEERQRAARIIEQTGVTEAEALTRARRAIAFETGEPFKANRADIDNMSVAELKAYIAAGGELPDEELTLDQRAIRGGDLTEEEAAEVFTPIFAAQEARARAAKEARERAPFEEQRSGDIRRDLSRGYTQDEAEARHPWTDYTQGRGEKPTSETDALKAQLRAMPRDAMGLTSPDADGEGGE